MAYIMLAIFFIISGAGVVTSTQSVKASVEKRQQDIKKTQPKARIKNKGLQKLTLGQLEVVVLDGDHHG